MGVPASKLDHSLANEVMSVVLYLASSVVSLVEQHRRMKMNHSDPSHVKEAVPYTYASSHNLLTSSAKPIQ